MQSILLGLPILALILWRIISKTQKTKREREELQVYLLAQLSTVKAAVTAFEALTSMKTGYFSNSQMAGWLADYAETYRFLKGRDLKDARLDNANLISFIGFVDYYEQAAKHRDKFNAAFVEAELRTYSSFFDQVEGRKLDIQQRTAIIRDEDANLVIAGAGSGKTTTIVGKVNYVIDRYQADPAKILLISFTKKSATTLASRINTDGVVAKTFHSFGMDIIRQVEGRQPSCFEEAQFKPLLKSIFLELTQKEDFLGEVVEYFTSFLKPAVSQFNFQDQGEYIQYIKDQNFRTYKTKELNNGGKVTYKMEVVKSIEECMIANFLLFNGVEYEYELPYEHETATPDKRQYRPDFVIFKDGDRKGQRIYLEHFGIARDESVPPFFAKNGETLQEAKERYWSKIRWARALHKEYRTTLLETYSHEMSEGTLFDNLAQRLASAGVALKPKSDLEKWKIINDAAEEEVEGILTLFQTFITLMKSNNYSFMDLYKKNDQVKDEKERERNKRFIGIVRPILAKYEAHLRERQEIDFSDMINNAAGYIRNGAYQRTFQYVIIDEFQDISIGRYKLIQAILEANPGCRMFCVGDDWQSIYRFAGSDIALFKDFSRFFPSAIQSRIETTYRFFDPLIKLSSDFILKNPNQTAKSLKGALSGRSTEYAFVYSPAGSQEDVAAVKGILDELMRTDPEVDKKTILILGRYGFDIKRLEDDKGTFKIARGVQIPEQINGAGFTRTADRVTYSPGGKPSLSMEFLTVHKSKGLEADIVIVINCNSGKLGFPSEMSDDRVLNLLLSEADQYENGEERRLFYVAMTRAKVKVYFVADKAFKSKFIAEIETNGSVNQMGKKCPQCKTADLVVRKSGLSSNGNKYTFWGCNNYLYGCEYNDMVWENKKLQLVEG